MTPPSSAVQAEHLQALCQARQRIVELLTVRSYLEEATSPGPLLAEVELKLADALAHERSLEDRRPLRRRVARMVSGLLVLGSFADDVALWMLELVVNAAPS